MPTSVTKPWPPDPSQSASEKPGAVHYERGRCLMVKTRREFTPEFKREAVALLESSGRSQMQVATELGIQPSMLRHWRTVLMEGSPPKRPAGLPGSAPMSPVASPSDQAAEIARLRRELDRTRMERDVLKKLGRQSLLVSLAFECGQVLLLSHEVRLGLPRFCGSCSFCADSGGLTRAADRRARPPYRGGHGYPPRHPRVPCRAVRRAARGSPHHPRATGRSQRPMSRLRAGKPVRP